MAAHRGKKFEGLNLEPVATVQTRSLRSHTVRTETSPCSGQLSTQSISEPTIEGNPGDNIEKQVKLTAEGLPENWIKEVKPQRNGLSRKNMFYVDSKTGYAFHSLEDVLRYIQTGSILSCVVIPQKRSREEVLILMNSSETKCMPCQTVKTQTQTATSSAQVTYQAKLGSGGLPADWIKEVKTRKKDSSRKDVFYIDPKTGYAFCSLKDALRYVETGDILGCASRPQKRSMEEIRILSSQTIKTESAASPVQPSNFIDDGISGDNVCKVGQENQLTSYGLPKRWIKELKPRKNGTKVDPIRILSTQTNKTESAASPVQQPSNFIDDGISGDNVCKAVQENQLISHGLPKSWIKELKPRKNGTKVDLFYIDPDTGYAFFSLKDALRYLATGNVLSCVMRPRKRSIEEVQALMSCSEVSSISGMKTVQRESLQIVQPDSLHRKRKRSPVKTSGLKAEEDSNIKGTDSATMTASRRVKQRIEGPLFVRASPHLLALKANIKADYDENHEENNVSCSTVPGMSNSSAPDLNRLLSSLPDPKTEEETMAENSSSTRTPLRNGKLRRERLMPHRVSPHLATPETTDITSVENKNSLMSKSAHEPTPSSHLYRYRRPCSHPNLEHKEETIEGASGSSTGILLQSRKMCRERPTPLRASSRLAALKATTDGSSVERENSMTSNALIEPSPFSLSYLNTRPTNQPDLELKEETIEVTEGSSTGTTRRRGKMHREKRTSLRASSRLAAHTDTTSVKNDNSMSNALFEPSPSLSHLKLRSTSQHDLELKEETTSGANSSSTKTPFHRGKVRRERCAPLRASSCLAAQKMTNDATSVQNENSTTSNCLFGPSPSALSFLNLRPTSQPDLGLKEETVEGANISSTETPLRRGKMCRERPTPLRASPHLATLDVTNNATSVENENSVTNNALFEPSPFSFSFLNVRPAGQPDMELQEERIQGDNGSSAGTPLKRGEKHRVRSVPLRASSCQAALKATTDCTSEENEDNIGSNAFSVPPPSHPDLNLGSTSLGDLQFKEVITGANGNGPRTVSLTEKLHSERPANIRNSSCLSALESTMGVAADENHEENNKTSNAVSELPLSPARPDLNLGPTCQPYWEPKEETISAVNDCAIRTASHRVEPQREMPTSVKTSPCPEALKVTTEATSSNSNEKNRMTSIALSELSHCPGRPDLNFGPTSQLTIERQGEVSRANGSATGTTLCRTKLHDVRPTPVNAMTEAASYYNYGNNIKMSNYFCVPVESPANKIIMGSTGQPNPREVWLDTIAAAPSTAIAEVKNAPDLNVAPMSWLEPEHNLERALEANARPKLEQQQPACVSNIGGFHLHPPVPSEIARPKLKQQQPACVSNIGEFHWQQPVPSEITRPKVEQQQQPACVSNIGEFHWQPPVPSEIPYQDPTMDALLSVQEAGPSMPHMSIDALNSPLSPFFGDFWNDPCLSYAFKTLVGGMDQQQADLGLRPENNINFAGARNGSHIENPCIGPSDAITQTPKYMNNGMPFPK